MTILGRAVVNDVPLTSLQSHSFCVALVPSRLLYLFLSRTPSSVAYGRTSRFLHSVRVFGGRRRSRERRMVLASDGTGDAEARHPPRAAFSREKVAVGAPLVDAGAGASASASPGGSDRDAGDRETRGRQLIDKETCDRKSAGNASVGGGRNDPARQRGANQSPSRTHRLCWRLTHWRVAVHA